MLNEFHPHLNEQHPAIQFTREEEAENRIAFLDVLVNRVDNRASPTVYRKNIISATQKEVGENCHISERHSRPMDTMESDRALT